MSIDADAPAVRGMPLMLLRLEGAALLVIATVAYARTGASWWLYAALTLVPDLSFLFYLAGARIGAIAYNAVHTTLGPIVLALVGIGTDAALAISIALIWLAHIGIDRLLGYGLKYASGFGFTHLGRIGRESAG
jgi:Domain of unknown function (DUF4260)